MTFREPTDDVTTAGVVPTTAMRTDEEREPEPRVLLEEDEVEESPVRPEAFAPLPSKGEDPVRLYLKEIGKVPLLNAQQEVTIGRRIEAGQIALRRALAGIPLAVQALLEVGDQLRRGDIPADDVIVLPEGGELEAKEIKPVLLAFARIRRHQHRIDSIQESLVKRRLAKTTRQTRARDIAGEREMIQRTVAEMPLKPALIDEIVA